MIASAPRAVVSFDGNHITLAIYRGTSRSSVELTPLRAVMLAHELLQAALPYHRYRSCVSPKAEETQMIEPTATDIGRQVIYRALGGGKIEEGYITSFNTDYVFVRYSGCTSAATRREDLEWSHIDSP